MLVAVYPKAPIVLYEIVRAVDPSKVVPEEAPEPLLLKVTALDVFAASFATPPVKYP